jgi:hypothetical protein
MRRFYPDTYKNQVKRNQWELECNTDYTDLNIVRREIGWGRIAIIGKYSHYMRIINRKMKPIVKQRKIRLYRPWR